MTNFGRVYNEADTRCLPYKLLLVQMKKISSERGIYPKHAIIKDLKEFDVEYRKIISDYD